VSIESAAKIGILRKGSLGKGEKVKIEDRRMGVWEGTKAIRARSATDANKPD
jgi:hypothetical protein